MITAQMNSTLCTKNTLNKTELVKNEYNLSFLPV